MFYFSPFKLCKCLVLKTKPPSLNRVGNVTVMLFFPSPCKSLAFSLLMLPQGAWGRVRGGCSVYSTPPAWHPACLLITLYSECLRLMWGLAVGSIGCNVTKHIRDGYLRIVKAPRSIQTPFCHSASLSSTFCVVSLPLCVCLFRLLCSALCFFSLWQISFMSELLPLFSFCHSSPCHFQLLLSSLVLRISLVFTDTIFLWLFGFIVNELHFLFCLSRLSAFWSHSLNLTNTRSH